MTSYRPFRRAIRVAWRSCIITRRPFGTASALLHDNPLGLPHQASAGLSGDGPSVPRMSRGLPTKRPIPGVKHVITVASGKGGVGKSTTTVNLALAIAATKRRVGILDGDIFGPSLPRLMNLKGEPELTEQGVRSRQALIPLVNYGVKCMSMGFLIPEDSPIVWRGLMVMKALQQLIHKIHWGELDYLVIDLPPGTGDVQLTVTQQVEIAGAVIVSTPQDLALVDAKKGANMFKKVNVPILGIVQNMSFFVCPSCSHTTHVFGENGVMRTAAEMGFDLLGDVPLNADVCELSDLGRPIVIAQPSSTHARCYEEIADRIIAKIEA